MSGLASLVLVGMEALVRQIEQGDEAGGGQHGTGRAARPGGVPCSGATPGRLNEGRTGCRAVPVSGAWNQQKPARRRLPRHRPARRRALGPWDTGTGSRLHDDRPGRGAAGGAVVRGSRRGEEGDGPPWLLPQDLGRG